MPAPVNINPNQRESLRQKLTALTGIKLSSHSECATLSQYLENKYSIRVSTSTIKRIFGLVKSTQSASIYSLNQLVKTVGFSSWSQFVEQSVSIDQTGVKMVILQDYLSLKSENYIQGMLDSPYGSYQLFLFIDRLISNKDSSALKSILDLDTESTNPQFIDDLYFSLQPISIRAERSDAFVINWVSENISSSKVLKKIVLQGNVFDEKLNSFYGEWISKVTFENNDDFSLFVSLMLCQQKYQQGDIKRALFYLKSSKEYCIGAKNQVHPILLGRICAWQFILENSLEMFESSLSSDETRFFKMQLIQFATKLIWQYKSENIAFPQIDADDWSVVPESNLFYEKGRADVMKLVLAINANNQSKISLAKSLIKNVNPINFHFSDRFWLLKNYHAIASS
jgi:hypothetical protein